METLFRSKQGFWKLGTQVRMYASMEKSDIEAVGSLKIGPIHTSISENDLQKNLHKLEISKSLEILQF